MVLVPVAGDLVGRLVAEAGLGSVPVEVLAVVLDHDARFEARVKQFALKALVSQLAVHGLALAVLPGASWLDVKGLHALLVQPKP